MHKILFFSALALAPAAALAQASGVTAGQWEIAVTTDTIDMPGQPAFIANMMRGKTVKVKHCITPEAAARGPQDMLKSDKRCVFTRYSMQGGRMNSAMTCQQPGGGTLNSVSSGSFTPTSFTAQGRSVVTGGQMPMTMTATTTARRVGDCR